MKKSRIQQIIKEEISKALKEDSDEIISRGIEYGINPEIDSRDVGTDRNAFINPRTPVLPKTNELLDFIKNNQEEVDDQVGNIYDLSIDGEGDVGARDSDGFTGYGFRYPEDVDDEFVGEDGDEPRPITVAGVDLMYIAYNI